MPCASPAKWHLAHTTWFFEERVLRVARGEDHVAFDPLSGRLFGSRSGASGAAWPREQRGLISRPTAMHMFEFDGGLQTVEAGDAGFALDAERPRHRTWLEPFAIGARRTASRSTRPRPSCT